MSEAALEALLAAEPAEVAIAVSGGVDSMTLAYLAHRTQAGRVTMFHASSAAVPVEATERVQQHATRHDWNLEVIDAGEVADPRYGSNPPDRCFWCKTNLYAAISRRTGATIFSGANLDDLDDYRPGLRAAAEHGVRHPWIEAGVSKTTIRRIAAEHSLYELAELPASPCLASRIETGIPVTVGALAAIDELERVIGATLQPQTLRCRLRPTGIEIQLDPAALTRADRAAIKALASDVMRVRRVNGEISFAEYQRGSAFRRPSDR